MFKWLCITGIICAVGQVYCQDLPERKMRDTSLEKGTLEVANEYSLKKKWGENYFKAIITSEEWSPLRDFATGEVTGRIIETAILGRVSDGSCAFRYFTVFQEKTGAKYSSPLIRYSSTFPEKCHCNAF